VDLTATGRTRRAVQPTTIGPIRGNRRGFSFCYAMALLGAMLLLGLAFLSVSTNSSAWAHDHYRQQQSHFLAEAALHRAVWMMQQSSDGTDNINLQLDHGGKDGGPLRLFTSKVFELPSGTFEFTATAPYKGIPGTAHIVATGTAGGGGQANEVKTELDSVARVYSAVGSTKIVPTAIFDYAVFSNHNGELKDKIKVYGHPEHGGKGVYVNGKLKLKGKPQVFGDLSVTGKFKTKDQKKLGPWPPGQYKREEKTPRVTMPTIDLAYYKSIAHEVYEGDLKLNGDDAGGITVKKGKKDKKGEEFSGDLGTPENPKIIFVEKKLELKGTFTGCGIIVAGKEVKFKDDVVYGSADSQWAILCAGKVKIEGASVIHGMIYAPSSGKEKTDKDGKVKPGKGKGKIEIKDKAQVFGCVIGDSVKLKKDAVVEWDPLLREMEYLPGTLRPGDPPIIDPLFWGKKLSGAAGS